MNRPIPDAMALARVQRSGRSRTRRRALLELADQAAHDVVIAGLGEVIVEPRLALPTGRAENRNGPRWARAVGEMSVAFRQPEFIA
jgi:hypothetical protein